MWRLLSKVKYRDLLLGAALLYAAGALLRWPQETAQAVREGLTLCGNVIIPSLFPFFVLSSLVVELGLSRYLGRLLEPIMHPLFRVGGACATALALGFVGGYPVGAKTAICLYQNGQCSKTETERLLAFCNNAGPAFILGVVGAGIFGSSLAGMLLFLTHVAASLIVGIVFRFYRPGDRPRKGAAASGFQTTRFAPALTGAVTAGAASALNICAFVLFFAVGIRTLSLSGLLPALSRVLSVLLAPAGLDDAWCKRLLIGLLEVSSGVSSLSGPETLTGRMSMAAFMLGWAGLSVHCQVLTFLGDSGLSMRTYFVGKLLHGGISAGLTALLLRFLPLKETAAAYLTEQVESIAALDFRWALTISSLCAGAVWLMFFAIGGVMVKKSGGKRARHRL